MWKPSQYAPEVLAAYREAAGRAPSITNTFCHATYLINLATRRRATSTRSPSQCLTHNLSVARGMGSSGLVLHVGSHKGAGFDEVVRQIADALRARTRRGRPSARRVSRTARSSSRTRRAPAARSVAPSKRFRRLIDACNGDDRLGLCIDTQHLWASGFDFSTSPAPSGSSRRSRSALVSTVCAAFHLNDSKIELGGNRDRHANIGEGTDRHEGLARLVGHPEFRDLPLLLEVPGTGRVRGRRRQGGTKVVVAGIKLYAGEVSRRILKHSFTVAAGRDADIRRRRSRPRSWRPRRPPRQRRRRPATKTSGQEVHQRRSHRCEEDCGQRRSVAKKSPAKKTAAKKSPAKKTAAKKAPRRRRRAKKSPAKKAAKKSASARSPPRRNRP